MRQKYDKNQFINKINRDLSAKKSKIRREWTARSLHMILRTDSAKRKAASMRL